MPRKHPPRGYYEEEEVYEVDHGRPRPRHRSKRGRMMEDEEFYPRRRASIPPPVEELERMRIRDRHGPPSSPEYVRESYTKGKGKVPPPPPGLKFRRGRGEVKRSTSIPPPPPSPPSEVERDDYRPSSRAKKPLRGRISKKIEPEEYVIKDRHGGRRGRGKQIAALLSDSEDDISVKRSSRAAAAAAAPPPPPPIPAVSPEDDDDESEAEFMRRERRRRKGKMVEPDYASPMPVPPRFPHKPNTGRHRGKEREDVRRRAASRSRARSLSARRVSSESDESETDTTESESSTEDSEDSEDDGDEEDDGLVILKDEWGRGHRRSRSMSRPAIKSHRDDSSPGSPSLREPSLASRHGRRPKYIEQGNCLSSIRLFNAEGLTLILGYEVVKPPPATGMDLAPRA